jgi:hypothetical protein
VKLISSALAFLFHLPLYQTSLQTYLWLLNTRWHEGSLKAKQHEAMTLERLFFVGYCSPIYREGEQLREKLQTCHEVYTHVLQNDAAILTTFPFLSCSISLELHILGIFMSEVSSVSKLVGSVHTFDVRML